MKCCADPLNSPRKTDIPFYGNLSAARLVGFFLAHYSRPARCSLSNANIQSVPCNLGGKRDNCFGSTCDITARVCGTPDIRIGQDRRKARGLDQSERSGGFVKVGLGGCFGSEIPFSPVNPLYCLLGSGEPKPLGLKVPADEYRARRVSPAPLPGATSQKAQARRGGCRDRR